MITFPKIDDKINVFRGVNINKIIRNKETAKHIQTFCVVFAYSIMIMEADEVIKLYLYYNFIKE